jgi:hypothetical protein
MEGFVIVDYERSSSYLHAEAAHEDPREVGKGKPSDCDVGELYGLSICFFCYYTIADEGKVFGDSKHKHVHFQDCPPKGNHECTQK